MVQLTFSIIQCQNPQTQQARFGNLWLVLLQFVANFFHYFYSIR
eukprot:COSAG06_NODE_62_length_27058_cov_17.867725_7_plen_44_part_00